MKAVTLLGNVASPRVTFLVFEQFKASFVHVPVSVPVAVLVPAIVYVTTCVPPAISVALAGDTALTVSPETPDSTKSVVAKVSATELKVLFVMVTVYVPFIATALKYVPVTKPLHVATTEEEEEEAPTHSQLGAAGVPIFCTRQPPFELEQFVQKTNNPDAGFTIASRCVLVIRGGRNPFEVLLTSTCAELSIVEVVPNPVAPVR